MSLIAGTTVEVIGIILIYLLMLFTAIRVIMDTSSAPKALGYLLLTFTVPVLGSIIYFTFGVNYRKKRIYNKKLAAKGALWQRTQDRITSASLKLREKYHHRLESNEDVVNQIENDVQEPLSSNQVTLLNNGEEKFPSVFEELEKAKYSIHIEYYIFSDDKLGKKLGEIVMRKAQSGVKVRVIYDDFGSSIKRKYIRKLKKAGVEIYPFFKVYFPVVASRVNYRNHRKIIVIDGHTGFMGGINVADYYINVEGSNEMYWRDTHIRIKGPGVQRLQYHFLADWNFCSGQQVVPDEKLFPRLKQVDDGNALMQIVSSGPDCPRPSIMLSYLAAIVSSREKVYITTPYFIPNESIFDAIVHTALSGKDVRLLVPEDTGSLFINAAARSYFEDLLNCGVRIFQYQKGFIHSKIMIVDDSLSITGSANLDYRSFDFNFEVISVIYGKKFCKELTDTFLNDLKDCKELTLEDWNKRSRLRELADKAARLLSPLM